jgi:type IV pilus assembly protein PilO
MKLSDFRNLDRNNIGGWPQGVKIVICAVIFVLIVLAGWYFEINDQQEELRKKQAQEETLKKEFTEKQAKVVNLEALKAQLDEMRDMLRQLLRQLPSKTEMPELLVNISQAALSAGLETQLFKPGAETVKEGFYAEKPIQLRMLGTYHQFGSFISGVAALPRVVILTMHDVALKPTGAKTTANGQLSLEGTIKTYRYVEEDESENGAAGKKPPVGKPGATPAKRGGK